MGINKGFSDRVEKWLGVIPGIGTYRKREKLRETDQKLRAYLSAQLQEVRSAFERIILELSLPKKMEVLSKINEAASQLQQVADSIKFANYGYTGIFDLKKIREDELKKIYDFDLSLIQDIKKMQVLMEGIGKNDLGDKLLQKVNELQASLLALDKKFRRRNDFLWQFS